VGGRRLDGARQRAEASALPRSERNGGRRLDGARQTAEASALPTPERKGVTAAKGFVASGVHCGIRKNDRLDLALVRSVVPATGAGMFTANRVLAAPVVLCKEHLELAQPQ